MLRDASLDKERVVRVAAEEAQREGHLAVGSRPFDGDEVARAGGGEETLDRELAVLLLREGGIGDERTGEDGQRRDGTQTHEESPTTRK